MRITVCETPHERAAVEKSWTDLCTHCRDEGTDLLVLPEFAYLEPVWESEVFDPQRWAALEREAATWLGRLPELQCRFVIGSVPANVAGERLNQGFLWSRSRGLVPLRSKRHLPNEPGGWEARWFTKGSAEYPAYAAAELTFGLNICTELWALDTFGPYAQAGVHAVVTPRATGLATTERWLALARTVAVRAGVFSLSSNRRHDDGSCGGIGWIIDPEGTELARTSASSPAVTRDINLADSVDAKSRYPRYVFTDA